MDQKVDRFQVEVLDLEDNSIGDAAAELENMLNLVVDRGSELVAILPCRTKYIDGSQVFTDTGYLVVSKEKSNE